VLYPEDKPTHTWTCSRADCGDCDGDQCPILSVEVSSLDPTLNLPPFPDCIYGDSVQLRGGDDLNEFMVKEIAIIEKHGETFLYVPTDGQLQFNMFFHLYLIIKVVCSLNESNILFNHYRLSR